MIVVHILFVSAVLPKPHVRKRSDDGENQRAVRQGNARQLTAPGLRNGVLRGLQTARLDVELDKLQAPIGEREIPTTVLEN